jgi:hypothetical protein
MEATLTAPKTASKKQLSLQLTSSTELTNFLKKFSPISGSLLIEIEGGYLKAKTHTPERSVVKSSKIELSRVFDGTSDFDKPLIFGVYSLDKLIKSFSHFDGSPVTLTIQIEDTPEGLVGTDIVLQNESLKINFQCATLRLFTHITDEMMDRIADTGASEVNFVLTKELQNRINSLTGIDSDQKLLTITVKGGQVKATGKSFDLNLLGIENKSADLTLSVYKSQFVFVDREDTMVYMNEDRLIFHSIETETKMIIGKAD